MNHHNDYKRTNVLASAHQIISNRFGIIANLQERRCEIDSYNVINYVAYLGKAFGNLERDTVNGGGSWIRQQSLAAAIGESVERYCLSIYHPSYLIRGNFSQIANPGCSLEDIKFFLDTQYENPNFPIRKLHDNWEFAWVQAFSVLKEKNVYIPASLVYLPYEYAPYEHALTYQLSVGTSCSQSFSSAALKAILEIVERDALTICWESRAAYPSISSKEVIEASEKYYDSVAVRLYSYDLTTDLKIPVILTLAIPKQKEKEPSVAIGIAADLYPWQALCKSIEEAITSWRSSTYLCRQDRSSSKKIFQRMHDRTNFSDHALFYARYNNVSYFDFLLNNPLPTQSCKNKIADQSQTDEDMLDICIKRIKETGHDILLINLTQPEIEDLGLKVIRAVCPTLVRQNIGIYVKHLANKRIREVPFKLGYLSKPISEEELLSHVNPFP